MSNEQPILKNVQLNLIRRDGGTQMRVEVDQKAVEEYAEQMKEEAKFPPVTLFDDSKDRWLADGFHRIAAWELAEKGMTIPCEIYTGSREDAIVYGIKKNRTNPVRFTKRDCINSLKQMLTNPKLERMGDRAIGEICGVSHHTVAKYRDTAGQLPTPPTRVGRDNREYPAVSPNPSGSQLPASNEPTDEEIAAAEADYRAEELAGIGAVEKALGMEIDEVLPTPFDTEDDWLNRVPIWAVLKSRSHGGAVARQSLLDYMKLEAAISTFKRQIALCKSAVVPDGTMFSDVLAQVRALPHPADWKICSECKGDGCNRCGNGGYDISGAGINPEKLLGKDEENATG